MLEETELMKAAERLGAWMSKSLRVQFVVAAYADPDNGRVCLNIYPYHDERKKRLRNQVKRNKAAIFNGGRRISDEQLAEEQ